MAMATYNGEKYIKEQLDSIVRNLIVGDEVVISDDGSTDSTKDIIMSFNDSRIHLIEGPKEGVKKNFENAIRNCSKKYIFLSDQDDLWVDGKVEKVLAAFEKEHCLVVVHDCEVVDENGKVFVDSFFSYRKSGRGAVKNFVKNTYIGCCMAFDSSLKDVILPIPGSIEMHDQWIGIQGDLTGKNVFIADKLIEYRRHEDNASDCFNHYGIARMITNRWHLFIELVRRNFRRKHVNG